MRLTASPSPARPVLSAVAGPDALTVLDESGVWVISRDPAFPALLAAHAWQAQFRDARDRVDIDMRIVVVGYALLEKSLAP